MRFLLFSVLVIMCATSVHCQEDGESFMDKIKSTWKKFVDSMKTMWGDLKTEIKARASDMNEFSSEMLNSFKEKMFEFIDKMRSRSDSEKEEMKTYVERLQMEDLKDN